MPPRLAVMLVTAATVVLVTMAQAPSPGALPGIEIVNDGHAREDVSLSFELPRGLPGEVLQLRDEQGHIVPVQVTTDRRAVFVLPRLEAEERRRLSLEPALDKRVRSLVEAVKRLDHVELAIDQRQLLVYRGEKTPVPSEDVKPILRRGGYIHPVLTPQGRMVTDDYPPNHLHHHGIWAAWSKTTFQGRHPDFWNMGTGSGTVEFEAVLDTWSGPVQGGLRARHRYVDLGTAPPTTAVTEAWEVTVHGVGRGTPAYRLFDLVLRHDVAAASALELSEYLYGPLGLRGHRSWDGPKGLQFLTSEGRTRIDGHGTRARWCHMGGLVSGRPAGIAVLDHPQNIRHPQTMRLHPTEPFFSYAPVQLGAMTIRPGEALVSRYRFVVYDGAPDAVLLDRLWHDFAHPPSVSVVR
jgi:Methane oxygenase PmoA